MSGFRAILAAISLLFLTGVSDAQDRTSDDILRDLIARQEASAQIGQMDRMAAWVLYSESVALLAIEGAWPSDKSNWDTDHVSPFAYDLTRLGSRLHQDMTATRRWINRQPAGEEKDRFEEALDLLSRMIADTEPYYDLLAKDDLDGANGFFRDQIKPMYRDLIAGTATLGSGIRSDVRRLTLEARMLE